MHSADSTEWMVRTLAKHKIEEEDVFDYAKDSRIEAFINCLALNARQQEADEVRKAIEMAASQPSVTTRIWAETLLAIVPDCGDVMEALGTANTSTKPTGTSRSRIS